jgi:hypothetical protein
LGATRSISIATPPERRVPRRMAHQTGPGVLAERNSAAPQESRRMRIGPSANSTTRPLARIASTGSGMAADAIPFQVAAHALSEVSLGLPSVVASRPRQAAPGLRRRVKATTAPGNSVRTVHRYPGPLVAAHTESLPPVATRAARSLETSGHGVRGQPIAGMYGPGTQSSIVAVGALGGTMAIGTDTAVSARRTGMAPHEVAIVTRTAERGRRHQVASRKCGHQPALLGDVADPAFTARRTARGLGRTVAAKADLHARELVASRRFDSLDPAVALATRDVPERMGPVVEAQIGPRERLRRRLDASVGAHVEVAEAAI